jgi:hypothetical protein
LGKVKKIAARRGQDLLVPWSGFHRAAKMIKPAVNGGHGGNAALKPTQPSVIVWDWPAATPDRKDLVPGIIGPRNGL